jgi:hypothetical protein
MARLIGQIDRRDWGFLAIMGAKLDRESKLALAGGNSESDCRSKDLDDERVGECEPDERPYRRPPCRAKVMNRSRSHPGAKV